jgi:flagellar motility protein MotE (MotC chaperone)
MRWIRLWVVASLLAKVVVIGAWWWTSVAGADKATAAEGSPAAETGVPSELLAKSRGFRELLEAVQQRGVDLDRREQEMAARETALKTLEQSLGEGPGREVAKAAAPVAAVPAEAVPPCSVAVTKIYQSMKPEEAAPILDRLDDETARAIFACMKEKHIGALLAAMNKDRAVALTKVLAGMPGGVVTR